MHTFFGALLLGLCCSVLLALVFGGLIARNKDASADGNPSDFNGPDNSGR